MKDFKLLKVAVAVAVAAVGMNAHAAKTLRFCSEGSPEGFDPGQFTSGTTFDASAETIYNRLVQFERGGTHVEPGLAEKWEVSTDGLVYTFKLRKGVKFHTTDFFKPSRDFNADDVVFTFDRMVNKENPFRKAYATEFPYATDMGMDDNLAKVEKVDDYTVKFTLKKVDAPFLQNMAMSFASILSAEYADKLLKAGKPTEINTAPIGTGPFVFKSYQKDSVIRYVANKNYWKKADLKLDGLVFSITSDAAVRAQKLKAGECDVVAHPKPADLAGLKEDAKLKIMSQSGFNLGYVSYNTTKKPLDNLMVRQALDMAINKKAILDAVYQGAGQAATNPMPPTQWSYNTTLKDAAYSPEKAKELLKKAGVAEGTEVTLWALPVQRPYNPNGKLMAEMIQADWKKIGINGKITTYEWGEYLKRGKAGEHDVILLGWTGDNGDPDNWLGTLLSCDAIGGNNYSRWCNKEFNDAVMKGKQVTDIKERTKLYMKAQEVFKKEVPFTTVAHSTVHVPMRKEVDGFKVSPFGLFSFYGVSLK